MLQKIEVSLQQLVGRPNVSREHLDWATDQVNLFFGSFRKADADNPEAFTAGCLRLFTAYDSEVVRYVVDPLTGLPGQHDRVWLPSLGEVKAALDQRSAELLRGVQRAKAEAQNLAERRKWMEARQNKPTLEDLQNKYGPNWGIPDDDKSAIEAKAKRTALFARASRVAFERMCEAGGISPRSVASPELIRILAEREDGYLEAAE